MRECGCKSRAGTSRLHLRAYAERERGRHAAVFRKKKTSFLKSKGTAHPQKRREGTKEREFIFVGGWVRLAGSLHHGHGKQHSSLRQLGSSGDFFVAFVLGVDVWPPGTRLERRDCGTNGELV